MIYQWTKYISTFYPSIENITPLPNRDAKLVHMSGHLGMSNQFLPIYQLHSNSQTLGYQSHAIQTQKVCNKIPFHCSVMTLVC